MDKIEKILTKISKIILNSIFVVLIIIAIILMYNMLQMTLGNKPYMNVFGYSFFKVKTGSMSGTLEIDDIIVVKLNSEVNTNDIVTYETNNILVTHRITKIEGETITTKGDANNAEDEPITRDDIIGKVVYTFKNVAIWKQVFTTPQVYILIIVTLILFGVANSIEGEKKE